MNILFIYKHRGSFIYKDIKLLKKHHDVVPFNFKFKKIFKLIKYLYKTDIVFIWFASYHAFITTLITRIIKRKIIIVTGGYDVHSSIETINDKKIKHGLASNPFYKKMVKYVLDRSEKILAVSKTNQIDIEKNFSINTSEIVYNSINYKKFNSNKKIKKENLVITISIGKTWERIKLKGIDDFIKSAKKLPDTNFMIIGLDKSAQNKINKIKPKNIKLKGFLNFDDLIKYYQKAKVYCQLSFFESFGVCVCEAMLCECVPVITNKGSLPEIVGDKGFYVEYGNIDNIVDGIKKALISKKGKEARNRIINLYSDEYREKKLKQIIENI